MKRAILVVALACGGWTAPAEPAAAGDFTSGAIGTSGSDFLALDSGARGLGLAGAYSALADDASSMYWNPAGLAEIPRLSATMTHNNYVAGINFEYLGYAQRISNTSVLGASIQYLDAGSIDQTDINGASLGSFHPRSYVYAFSMAQTVPEVMETEMSAGITGKFLRSDMTQSANGFALDMGLQARYPRSDIPHSFSFVVENLGEGQKFDGVRSSLPLLLKTGGAATLWESLSSTYDIFLPMAGAPHAAFGSEYALTPDNQMKLALRAGLDTQAFGGSLDGFHGFNFGFGLTFSGFTFDYAFVPMGILGNTHRISLSFNLPSPAAPRP